MSVHPIEVESYRRMFDEVDFTPWTEPERAIVARIVHGSADPAFVTSTRIGAEFVRAGVSALRAGAPVITDAEMVAAGMPTADARCYLSRVTQAPRGSTRAAAAMAIAAAEHPLGAMWVIGNAPTALAELLALHAGGAVRPAIVIGLPVGFVGAAEAKAALWESPLGRVAVTNEGRRGGSAVAASAFNALARLAGQSNGGTRTVDG